MTPSRPAKLLLFLFSLTFVVSIPIGVQGSPDDDKQQQAAIRKTQGMLADIHIDGKQFNKAIPLTKFLDLVEKHLKKDQRISLRIDKAAFGDKNDDVAATPIALRAFPQSLSTILDVVVSKIKTKSDYRIDGGQVTITTPDRALFTVEHDIHDVVTNPEVLGITYSAFRNADQAKKAELFATRIVTAMDLPAPIAQETIEVVNGARLSIRTVGSRHAPFVQALSSFRRLVDVAVTTKAQLYEVDDAFYTKLKNAKRLSVEDAEQLFLEGKFDDSFSKNLTKQKLILTGADVLVNSGQEATLLSRQVIRQCLPALEQIRQGDKNRQSFVTGLSIHGNPAVSPARRFIHLKLTEKAVELEEIQKTKVTQHGLQIIEDVGKQDVKKPKDIYAEIPVLKETTQTRVLQIPDGGSILIPLQYRPRSAQENNRWLVLSITSRIVMEEEERHILLQSMQDAIPGLVADVLANPRLRTTRDYCGTPGDKRIALVNSDAWTWPKDFRPKIAGLELTPANAAGNRLLGIRIDGQQWTKSDSQATLSIRVSLVNAGGGDNGTAIGGCSLRYAARPKDKGWSVELIEP